MATSLRDLYHLLGVPPGSDAETLKKAHKALVRKWHPDRYLNPDQKADAEQKLARINAAYHRLKTVKYRAKATKNASERRGRTQKTNAASNSYQSYHQRQETSQKKAPKANRRVIFEQSWLDRKLTLLNNRMQQSYLRRRKETIAGVQEKELEKQDAFWFRKRRKWHAKTRVGLYDSFINYLIFGNLEVLFSSKESHHTTLGSFHVREKYEMEVRHNIIRDRIFYAVNRTWNIVLKYVFGIAILSLFVITISDFFAMGRITGSMLDFFRAQVYVLGLVALLIFPDNLYQRFLLWKFRGLASHEVDVVFSNRSLPKPWSRILYAILIPKYGLLTLLVFF